MKTLNNTQSTFLMNIEQVTPSFFQEETEQLNVAFPWLLVLKWGEVCCQVLLILVVSLTIDIELPPIYIGLIIGGEILTTLLLHIPFKKGQSISKTLIFLLFLVDTLLLTGLLHLTGGAMNPFTFLYLVHIVIGAIILEPKYSWAITILTIGCYGLLFLPPPVTRDLSGTIVPESGPICHMPGEQSGALLLHLRGMWLAFGITSFFIVFFVSKIQQNLASHNKTLLSLREARLRNERLTSLTGLAAGAAHELSTPLNTITVVAEEMVHQLKAAKANDELIDDTRLIQNQIHDCKEILYQIAAGAGELRGEQLRSFPPSEAVDQILGELDSDERLRIHVNLSTDIKTLHMGFRNLCRTIKGLLKNSLEASPPDTYVNMNWLDQDDIMVIEISDNGSGIHPEIHSQVMEPFFTTKETGMGLGLFLAKTMAEQLGGSITIDSTVGVGTTVTLFMPLNRIT